MTTTTPELTSVETDEPLTRHGVYLAGWGCPSPPQIHIRTPVARRTAESTASRNWPPIWVRQNSRTGLVLVGVFAAKATDRSNRAPVPSDAEGGFTGEYAPPRPHQHTDGMATRNGAHGARRMGAMPTLPTSRRRGFEPSRSSVLAISMADRATEPACDVDVHQHVDDVASHAPAGSRLPDDQLSGCCTATTPITRSSA